MHTLAFQIPPETIFGPINHTQKTFLGGDWMSRDKRSM